MYAPYRRKICFEAVRGFIVIALQKYCCLVSLVGLQIHYLFVDSFREAAYFGASFQY